eukprot:460790-Pyramimonas_sp.AAC.1
MSTYTGHMRPLLDHRAADKCHIRTLSPDTTCHLRPSGHAPWGHPDGVHPAAPVGVAPVVLRGDAQQDVRRREGPLREGQNHPHEPLRARLRRRVRQRYVGYH